LVLNSHDEGVLGVEPSPTISIIDHNSYLPVDLARKGLSRPDPELTAAIRKSVYLQFLAELASSNFDSPSQLIEWWEKSDFPISGSGWVPFLFGRSGFCILDRTMIHALSLKRLLVQKLGILNLKSQLEDDFFDSETCTVLRTEGHSSSKTSILEQLKETWYYNKIPVFGATGRSHEIYFADRYFVLEKKIFSSLFSLANRPSYLNAMADTALTFKVKDKEYVIVSRFSNLSNERVRTFAQFCRRTFRPSSGQPIVEPIILWENYSSSYNQISPASEAWRQFFEVTFLPYRSAERASLVKKARDWAATRAGSYTRSAA
jgi:hypothetical protein